LPSLPDNARVDAAVTARQLRTFHQLWHLVDSEYLDPNFNGHDWEAIGQKYFLLISGGLSDADFYYAMKLMIAELGDDHSNFLSPEEAAQSRAETQGHNDFIGFGFALQSIPDTNHAVILYVFANSPAAAAGLRAHDILMRIDGQPAVAANGSLAPQLRGPAGSRATLTIQRPGLPPHEVTLTRERITGAVPVDYCVIPHTRVAYIYLPTLADETIADQVRTALLRLTARGELEGVILDNRENNGGAYTQMKALLGFFTQGYVGDFVNRAGSQPLYIQAESIANSQTTPLVVLVSQNTVSYAEIFSGILQHSGRARLVGTPTAGNVESLWTYDLEDGSQAWIAHDAFRPVGLAAGAWEGTGLIPEVIGPTRWDWFTEATDPAWEVALELLSNP